MQVNIVLYLFLTVDAILPLSSWSRIHPIKSQSRRDVENCDHPVVHTSFRLMSQSVVLLSSFSLVYQRKAHSSQLCRTLHFSKSRGTTGKQKEFWRVYIVFIETLSIKSCYEIR